MVLTAMRGVGEPAAHPAGARAAVVIAGGVGGRAAGGSALVVTFVLAVAGCSASSSPRVPEAPARRPPASAPRVARSRPPAVPEPAHPAAPPRDDSGPLTAKIRDGTPPNRAAALRLTEQARGLLASGDDARAIEVLERAIAVDASAPYAYYFLAMAHCHAHHPGLARPFLDRAQQKLAAEPYWLAEVHALRGKIAEDEGRRADARAAYERALAVNPKNAGASAGLARLGAGEGAP